MSTSSSASSSPSASSASSAGPQQPRPAGPGPEAEEELEVCSLVSDYSELTAQVRAHFTAAGGRLVRREDLRVGNTQPADAEEAAEEEETAEGRARRLRKHNLLSLAVEFAQLKQVDRAALPFGLHRLAADSTAPDDALDEEEGAETEEEEEETAVPMEEGSSDEPPIDDSEEEDDDDDVEEECELRPVTFSVLGEPERSSSEERQPTVAWTALEADLRRAQLQQEEEEESLRRAYRLERARVLESLTMAGREPAGDPISPSPGIPRRLLGARDPTARADTASDQDDSETDSTGGPNSWRRQHGRLGAATGAGRMAELTKPMQLCFINDISSDEDFTSEPAPGLFPRRPPAAANPAALKAGPLADRADNGESLLQRQSQLQAEAKLALAQAQPMAKMQLELEKQTHAAAIVKQVVAMAGGCGRQLTESILGSLNAAQLQRLVADFRAQIEELNRNLMDLLLERDDLHMEQDSKLLDVEDLTRRAQEIASKLQEEKQRQQASPARSSKERNRSGSAASRAQAKARSTTRAVTSRLAAFFKSSNQTSPASGTST